MPETARARLLIVDDELPQLRALCTTLEGEGFLARGFSDPGQALAALREAGAGSFDLLLTDLRMPGMDGLELLRAALEADPGLVVIVMTGHGTIDTAVGAMKSGALDYILKPFKLSAMLPVLERALGVRRLRQENALLARRVAERTSELEAANRDLESFSYSVSHDLRAPLRHVQGFAQMLAKEHASSLPPEGQRKLQVITDAARKMDQLIEDLLRFSRLGRQALSLQPVDLAAQAKEVLAELREREPGRPLEIRVGDLPPCVGDPALLRQVWVNLLSNAFKFTRKREDAAIEIGCAREEQGNVYFVRDNGAGFDMRLADRIFGVFQRLHPEGEFEGTGVGLSIVQRVIKRHGGSITVQAAPGEGAMFRFTLPESPLI